VIFKVLYSALNSYNSAQSIESSIDDDDDNSGEALQLLQHIVTMSATQTRTTANGEKPAPFIPSKKPKTDYPVSTPLLHTYVLGIYTDIFCF